MLKNLSLVFLASASCLGAGIHHAAAFDSVEYVAAPRVYYADQPAPRAVAQRTATAERPRMGGGFIEFLFTDGP